MKTKLQVIQKEQDKDEDVVLELALRKVGNSLIVTIPKEFALAYNLKEGSTLELIPEKDNFVIRIHKR